MTFNLIILGPPGAGKGTQTAYLIQKYGLYKVATGDLIRKEINTETEIGRRVKAIVHSGGFPDDDLMNALVRNSLKQALPHQGLVFDGYPRRLSQAEYLDHLLASRGVKVDFVVTLNADEALLMKRIVGRFSCQSCEAVYSDTFHPTSKPGVCDTCGGKEFVRREDDSKTALKTRLALYHQETQPIVNYYLPRGIVHYIDGMNSIEVVSEAIDRLILKAKQ